ncbi:MAG: hypothetical protein NTV70_11415 [Acidobacteria bacterium]|nr:hypothetical protein [Acidobacteriota bacterium]MCX6596961.1 hypothetical protein [Acidobacteriota bacterium]
MRTTIELKPEHRARLLELSARRGEKGFSTLIGEALDEFLLRQDGDRRREALAALRDLQGLVTDEEATVMKANVRKWRKQWRSS